MEREDDVAERHHLTYSMNVHATESVEALVHALDTITGPVARAVNAERAMGAGMWLPAPLANELRHDPRALMEVRRALARNGLFALTLNAFPYRGFHDARVKERVFAPAWDDRARVSYTLDCAAVLAELLPLGVVGSISTVPIGLASALSQTARFAALSNVRAAAEGLVELERVSGRRIVLALEPEPCGELQTVDDAIAWIERLLPDRDDPLRAVLGVCLDACHEAVAGTDAAAALARLLDRGITLGKIQVTSALEVEAPGSNAAGLERLRGFIEPRYFHQTSVRAADGTMRMFPDLEVFFAAWDAGDVPRAASRVRSHFHVPVFAAPRGGMTTTRRETEALLAAVARAGIRTTLEVETYTFDVVPADERAELGATTLAQLIERELRWTGEALR
ncbi:MAG: metabolite traffic protein EboE [Planctomycetes bacterium]|nr:metabolite traffic protein EboE [Planctomycetota bacterium]MCC7172502.1 metabolite traffic protein EboE [Planctomycetota bacterium]